MKKLLLVVLLFIAFISCKKSTDNLTVSGTWIETTQGMDTINFVITNPYLVLNLSRQGMTPGYPLIPTSHVGPYVYTLQRDTIVMRPLVSNSLYTNHFYFNIDPETNILSIGNFYDTNKVKGTILTFAKKK